MDADTEGRADAVASDSKADNQAETKDNHTNAKTGEHVTKEGAKDKYTGFRHQTKAKEDAKADHTEVKTREQVTKPGALFDPKPYKVVAVHRTQIKGMREDGKHKTRDSQKWKRVQVQVRRRYADLESTVSTSKYLDNTDIGAGYQNDKGRGQHVHGWDKQDRSSEGMGAGLDDSSRAWERGWTTLCRAWERGWTTWCRARERGWTTRARTRAGVRDVSSYLLANPRLVEAPQRLHSSASHRCSSSRTRYPTRS